MNDVLFEIGTEELPAGFLQPALSQLEKNFKQQAASLKLSYGDVVVMGTPRRLAVLVTDIIECQPDSREELMGPSKKAGFDAEGNPTKAAQGFARSKGADVDQLQVVDTPKGEYLMLVQELKGKPTAELLPDVLKTLLLELSFAKSMKWGSNHVAFARPIQWIVALLNDAVIPIEHEGIVSSNVSRGHRFMANEDIVITHCSSYEEQMLAAHIVVHPEKRRQAVLQEIKGAVQQSVDNGNAAVSVDEALVDTVTNLVEIPFGVCGRFDDKFLALPDDVLITSMRVHQKYFPVIDETGALLPYFVAVNNTSVNDIALTRTGHERVLRARLEDALFFYHSDQETKLDDRLDNLTGIIFQAKLGTMREKKDRIVKLSSMLANKFAADEHDAVCRTAELCKADLLTDMVGEFPLLQGVMGAAYAEIEKESAAVVTGIQEHYMPLRAGAALPSSQVGAIVGLADRLDTLAGCFGIGQVPTGTTDPFGLRRLALAILHIIRDRGYEVSLREIVHKALALYGEKVDGSAKTVETIVSFIKGRYVNDCVAGGLDPQAVEAVTSVTFDDVNDCRKRIDAFIAIRQQDAFNVLAASFKRIRNIIKDNNAVDVDGAYLQEQAERELYELFLSIKQDVETLLADKEYYSALEKMLEMKQPVDTFFDDVMVMAEDANLQRNRLNLLTALGTLVLQVGDISKMHQA